MAPAGFRCRRADRWTARRRTIRRATPTTGCSRWRSAHAWAWRWSPAACSSWRTTECCMVDRLIRQSLTTATVGSSGSRATSQSRSSWLADLGGAELAVGAARGGASCHGWRARGGRRWWGAIGSHTPPPRCSVAATCSRRRHLEQRQQRRTKPTRPCERRQ